MTDLIVIPAKAVIVDMNPNTQLSGGVAPVSLFRDIHKNNKKKHIQMCEAIEKHLMINLEYLIFKTHTSPTVY